MVHYTYLLNTQYYKMHIKDKVEKYKERISTLPFTLIYYLTKREPSDRSRLRSLTYVYIYLSIYIYIDYKIN